METIQRSKAGQRLWDQHLRNLRPFLYFTVLVAIVLPVLMFAMLPTEPEALDRNTMFQHVALIAFAGAAFFFPNLWDKKYGNNEKGARGEIAVGRELEKLHVEGFHVFHGYKPENYGDVDHFLIGKQGAFIVETKAWSGEITTDGREILVDGRQRSNKPVSQARRETLSIRHLLQRSSGVDVRVRSILCFKEADVRVYGKVRGVEVTSLGALRRSIMQIVAEIPDDERLSHATVNKLSERLTTYLGEKPAVSPDAFVEIPRLSHRILRDARVWVAVYAAFISVLTVVFAEKTVAMFEGLASIYHALGLLKSYYL